MNVSDTFKLVFSHERVECCPWGLGTTWDKLRPHLVAGLAKKGRPADEIERMLQLETVPEPAPPKAGPGRGHFAEVKKDEDKTTPHREGPFPHAQAERLRAINRAPDVVKDAYREGRISQTSNKQAPDAKGNDCPKHEALTAACVGLPSWPVVLLKSTEAKEREKGRPKRRKLKRTAPKALRF